MASEVELGDIFFSRNERGLITKDRVISARILMKKCKLSNVIILGHVIADDIVVSIRVDGDMPESLWNTGEKINALFGPTMTHYYCRFGNWFRKTNMAALL